MTENETPRWMQVMRAKHDEQIEKHEAKFGKLGELQTDAQKKALKNTLTKMESKS